MRAFYFSLSVFFLFGLFAGTAFAIGENAPRVMDDKAWRGFVQPNLTEGETYYLPNGYLRNINEQGYYYEFLTRMQAKDRIAYSGRAKVSMQFSGGGQRPTLSVEVIEPIREAGAIPESRKSEVRSRYITPNTVPVELRPVQRTIRRF
jgi:hypothetical protein